VLQNEVALIFTTKELPPRRPDDFYPTSPETVQQALALVSRDGFTPTRILDPGSGEGAWGAVARKRWPPAHITGVELRDVAPHPAYDVWLTTSFLTSSAVLPSTFSLVAGNPPYRDAEAFIRAGLELLEEGGRLVFLLRWAFAEGQARGRGLFREYPPRWLVPCSKRPSFTGDDKTNATAFGFYVWEKGWKGPTQIFWRPPVEETPTKGRPRKHATHADRQAAHRRRKKEQERANVCA
jgi:hypothetical protein